MEDVGKIKYREINDKDDFSYLWLKNKSDKYVSRIDLTVMSSSSSKQVAGEVAKVVCWQPIEEAIARAGNMTDKEVTDVMKQLKDNLSDHQPTLTRFYFDIEETSGQELLSMSLKKAIPID